MTKKIPLKLIINSISHEKCISEEIIFNAIKDAIVYTIRKKHGLLNITIHINKKNGTYKTYIIHKVIEDSINKLPIKNPTINIPISQAKKKSTYAKTGDIIEQEIKSIDFGRIDTQIAKYVIIQKVKLAERELIIKKFSDRKKTLISGIIKNITKDHIVLDIGNNVEGLLTKKNTIPKETFRLGDKTRAYFTDISKHPKGPEIILSRTCDQMLTELFKIEVPEINEGIINIKNIARDPGFKAKISVTTNHKKLDPIGACIGIRGSRIQAISNELYGEKIDIILWDQDPIKYVINSLSPTEIDSIEIDNEAKSMNITVKPEYLSRTIGKNGQNIKLASKLTSWELNIITSDHIKTSN